MADSSFPLALRPWPADSQQDEPLVSQLARISTQFGQYRHMNEDKLKKMIADQDAGIAQAGENPETGDEEEGEEDEEEVDVVKKRREDLHAAKAEMFKHINDAQQEILYTIDFLGLLLSKDNSRGVSYMSPMLRQSGIPEGSFAYDKWPTKQPDERQKKQQDLVAKGWTMEGLGASADSLLQAATRLEKEVRKETQYWGQILSITERGWSLRRVPRESGTLGVQYGFSEASDQFKARGFAALRAKEDGSIILDQALVQKPKSIRVRIIDNAKVVGSSHQGRLASALQSDLELEDLIRRARDSLFEQELFQEMTMESRLLLSHNVRFRDHVIIIPTGLAQQNNGDAPRREIHVDLVGVEDLEELSTGYPEDKLAEDIALALRLLLSHTHSQRLKRRSQPPPPLTDRKRPDTPPSIIRTLLNYICHHAAMSTLGTYLRLHKDVLARAHVDLQDSREHAPLVSDVFDSPASSARSRVPLLDTLMTTLSQPIQSTIKIPLPSSHTEPPLLRQELSISLRTVVAPPTQGTEISVTLPPCLTSALYLDQNQGHKRTLSFDTLKDLTEYLDYVLSIDLAHNIAAKENPQCTPVDREPEVEFEVAMSNETAVNQDASGRPTKVERKKLMKLEVHLSGHEKCLRVRWWAADKDEMGEQVVWDHKPEDAESRSFKEVVGTFTKIKF